MPRTVKVAIVGLGSVGQAVDPPAPADTGVKLVGVADPAPASAGKDLGTVLGLPRRLRIKVEERPRPLLQEAPRRRGHRLHLLAPQGGQAPGPRRSSPGAINVLTTCEELAFPVPAPRGRLTEIDRAAKRKKVSVLATGVNPGFAMDALALALTAPCTRVRRVSVTRVAGRRRRAGSPSSAGSAPGSTSRQFRRAVTEGTVRHVGLVESAHMIASALGLEARPRGRDARARRSRRATSTPSTCASPRARPPASARRCAGTARGELAVSLDLQVYVGAESPRDHVLIDADPPVDATIAGGVNGEVAAAAILVNTLPRLLAAPPGLLTVKDLPLVHALNPHDLAPAASPEALGGDGRRRQATAMKGELAEGVVPDLLRELYVGRRNGTLHSRQGRRGAEPPLPPRPHRQRPDERRGGAARRDARAPRAPLRRTTSPGPPRWWCATRGGWARCWSSWG